MKYNLSLQNFAVLAYNSYTIVSYFKVYVKKLKKEKSCII